MPFHARLYLTSQCVSPGTLPLGSLLPKGRLQVFPCPQLSPMGCLPQGDSASHDPFQEVFRLPREGTCLCCHVSHCVCPPGLTVTPPTQDLMLLPRTSASYQVTVTQGPHTWPPSGNNGASPIRCTLEENTFILLGRLVWPCGQFCHPLSIGQCVPSGG